VRGQCGSQDVEYICKPATKAGSSASSSKTAAASAVSLCQQPAAPAGDMAASGLQLLCIAARGVDSIGCSEGSTHAPPALVITANHFSSLTICVLLLLL
jgi:hypothetical protein